MAYRYQKRISGPLLDRTNQRLDDIHVDAPRGRGWLAEPDEKLSDDRLGEPSILSPQKTGLIASDVSGAADVVIGTGMARDPVSAAAAVVRVQTPPCRSEVATLAQCTQM
jgi:hypothetical protein